MDPQQRLLLHCCAEALVSRWVVALWPRLCLTLSWYVLASSWGTDRPKGHLDIRKTLKTSVGTALIDQIPESRYQRLGQLYEHLLHRPPVPSAPPTRPPAPSLQLRPSRLYCRSLPTAGATLSESPLRKHAPSAPPTYPRTPALQLHPYRPSLQAAASDWGSFVGASSTDYLRLLHRHGATATPLAATAGTLSVASGRLSFIFGLSGPAVTTDTACSSSLVACQGALSALRLGQCGAAVVGGVNLTLLPDTPAMFQRAGR